MEDIQQFITTLAFQLAKYVFGLNNYTHLFARGCSALSKALKMSTYLLREN